MLDRINLKQKADKSKYKSMVEELEIRLGELQRMAHNNGVPVIIVFEGWDAAGKGTLINKLMMTMDPRNYNVYPTNPPNEEEIFRPFLWRFWTKTPPKGKIAIFDRSWYGRVLVGRVNKLVKKHQWQQAFDEINSFERQLADDGNIIIKFFLHIDKKEQKKRFKKLLKNKSTAWKVTEDDWQHHNNYEKHFQAAEDMLAKTDTAQAPWTVVEAHDRRFAILKVLKAVADALENGILKQEQRAALAAEVKNDVTSLNQKSILDEVDLTHSLNREEYNRLLKKYQKQIRDLEHEAYLNRIPVMIIYQGWDAAGKGGNIKRLVQGMDPRGFEVATTAAPNDLEASHHYLWRFWNKVPKAGHITIFDRSWYGRVLVERVEGFCTPQEWQRAYREINEMEQQFTNYGVVLIKFWLHIGKDEQLKRFKAREVTPHKQWKITEEDWRNREKWDDYKTAVDDMLCKTSTPYAPWTIVEANCKLFARIKAIKTVVKAIEKKL